MSESHLHKLPVYLFVLTLEFIHRSVRNQNIYRKREQISQGGVEYSPISHSQDIINLNLVDHIITERGEIRMDEIGEYRTV